MTVRVVRLDFTRGFLSSTRSLEFSQILICYILHKPRVSKTTNISLDWALVVSYSDYYVFMKSLLCSLHETLKPSCVYSFSASVTLSRLD